MTPSKLGLVVFLSQIVFGEKLGETGRIELVFVRDFQPAQFGPAQTFAAAFLAILFFALPPLVFVWGWTFWSS